MTSMLATPDMFKEMMENKNYFELVEYKKDIEEKIKKYEENNTAPDDYYLNLHKEYLKIVEEELSKKTNNN